MVEVPGSGVDIMGNATGAPNQVWVSDGPATPYAESVGKAVTAAASLASGLATLTAAGIYNQGVKIGSGMASIRSCLPLAWMPPLACKITSKRIGGGAPQVGVWTWSCGAWPRSRALRTT